MPVGKIGFTEEFVGTAKSGVFTIKDQFVLSTEDLWPRGSANNLISSFAFSDNTSIFSSNVQTRSTGDGYTYGVWTDVNFSGPRYIYLDFVMNRPAICSATIPGPDISGYARSFGTPNWSGPTNTPGWGNTGKFPSIRLTPGKNRVQIYLAGRNPTTLYSSSNPIYVTVRDI
jgi:hypothetical protein